jgi:hypothetical protein
MSFASGDRLQCRLESGDGASTSRVAGIEQAWSSDIASSTIRAYPSCLDTPPPSSADDPDSAGRARQLRSKQPYVDFAGRHALLPSSAPALGIDRARSRGRTVGANVSVDHL